MFDTNEIDKMLLVTLNAVKILVESARTKENGNFVLKTNMTETEFDHFSEQLFYAKRELESNTKLHQMLKVRLLELQLQEAKNSLKGS